jgi:hypothetical protein
MPACTRRAIAMGTDFFAADDLEATARRPGGGPRRAKSTGTLWLALRTCGTWSEGKTTLAQLAAKGTPWHHPVAVSPAAMPQRLHKKALALLQAMLRQVLGTRQSLPPVGEEGLCAAFPNVSLADSTGVALPAALHKTWPSAGGSAATAGAQMQAVWASPRRLLEHGALPPWHLPDPRDGETVVALAPPM